MVHGLSTCSVPFDDLDRDATYVAQAMLSAWVDAKLRANFQMQVLVQPVLSQQGLPTSWAS
jgi:isocitrate dehydrogenase kinase/phosphatase